MIKMGKRGLAMLVCMLVLAGCNTIAGAGKDVQKVGEKVEEAAGK
jgi:predicted small secreted protein